MAAKEQNKGMLSPYRVLDLTDINGLLCGKLLGDLGADVIKVERPGGDSARNIGPFYHDKPDPEKSLLWFAFNTSKRGITLNIETADGRELFKKLVKTADFVIESFPRTYMDSLGLGYSDLEKVNPLIIMVSITPYGQSGPYSDYKSPDIVACATGGRLHPFGDEDRSPVKISHHPQIALHAGAEAATGALMALYHRQTAGEGQHVDVSAQATASRLNQAIGDWDAIRQIPPRGKLGHESADIKRIWPCKDGHVVWFYWGGPQGLRWNPAFIEWMDSEGMADDFIKNVDWLTVDHEHTTQETIDKIEAPTGRFFMSHTKLELLEGAVKRNLMLCPVASTADIRQNRQLEFRGFWTQVKHPELRTQIPYPGPFGRFSEMSPEVSRRAPLIGEHNEEIYIKELGLSREELVALKQAGVV